MLNNAVLAVQRLMKDSRWRKQFDPFLCRDSSLVLLILCFVKCAGNIRFAAACAN